MAGLESVAVASAFLGFGYLLAGSVAHRRETDALLLWALSFPALAGYALVLMLAHIATGGLVLSTRWLTRSLTLSVAAVLGTRALIARPRGETPGKPYAREWLLAVIVVLAAVALWGNAVFRLLPLHRAGDTLWHMGLASELLNGERVPGGAVTGDIPNYYPWLYHAMVALLAQFTPGGTPFNALAPLQLLQVTGGALALFGLGRQIGKAWTAGVATVAFGAIAGPLFRYNRLRLYSRSYNVALHFRPPPFSRDVALVLLIAFLLLLVIGLTRRSARVLAAAGVVLGLAGLAGAEAFLVGTGTALLIALFPLTMPGRRVAAALLLPAFGVYALWLVPLAINYLRLGGFVRITLDTAVNLPPHWIAASWGVAVPFAAYGLVRWLPRIRADAGGRVAFALLAVSAGVLVVSAVVPGALGEAFLSLGRRHRYWPLVHLGIALYAALGASEFFERQVSFRKAAVAGACLVFLAFALPSSLVASLDQGSQRGASPLDATLRGARRNVLNVIMASRTGRACTAAVPQTLSMPTFAYTGCRLVLYRWFKYRSNLARIRWRDIYEYIPGDTERTRDNRRIITGSVPARSWAELVRKYGVDLVVVPGHAARAPAFHAYRRKWGKWGRRWLLVVFVDRLGGHLPRD